MPCEPYLVLVSMQIYHSKCALSIPLLYAGLKNWTSPQKVHIKLNQFWSGGWRKLRRGKTNPLWINPISRKLKPISVFTQTPSSHWNRYKGNQSHLNDFMGVEPSKKRKRRTSFTPQALELLNAHFERNTHPSGEWELVALVAVPANFWFFVVAPFLQSSLDRYGNHWHGSSAGLRTGGDPNMVLQQATGPKEYRPYDVQGDGIERCEMWKSRSGDHPLFKRNPEEQWNTF